MFLLLKIWITIIIIGLIVGASCQEDSQGKTRDWAERLLIGSLFATAISLLTGLLVVIWIS